MSLERQALVGLLVLPTLLLAGGCTSLADRIVAPDKVERVSIPSLPKIKHAVGIESHAFTTKQGVRIAWYRVPAAKRDFEYRFTENGNSLEIKLRASGKAQRLATRGTVVLLHGWSFDSSSMLPWALALSEYELQAIAMDLRNHGRSSRAPAGYGSREAEDLAALLDELRRRGQLQLPVHLLGVSYGAATALLAEPELRDEIGAIVAIEPYANAADAIASLVRSSVDDTDWPVSWLVNSFGLYDADDVTEAITEAGVRLGLDLHRIDPGATLAASGSCTLLIHGGQDEMIPIDVARRLARSSPDVAYVELPEETHLSLPLRVGWLAPPIAEWLQAATSTGPCPAFRLPPEPLPQPDPTPPTDMSG